MEYDSQDGITTSTCGPSRSLASLDEVHLMFAIFEGMLSIGEDMMFAPDLASSRKQLLFILGFGHRQTGCVAYSPIIRQDSIRTSCGKTVPGLSTTLVEVR